MFEKLHSDLLNEIYKKFNLYNRSPNLFSEKDLLETISSYNNFIKNKGLESIQWPRDPDSFNFEEINVIYIPCGIIKFK